MSKAKLYCGGCGRVNVGAFETCPKCGWCALTAGEAMQQQPQKPEVDWKEIAAMLASALRFRRDYPMSVACSAVDAAVLRAYKVVLEADNE